MILAAIDIGSNAIRLKVARVRNGSAKTLEKKRSAVSLGKDVFALGFISQGKLDEVVKTLFEFKATAVRLGAHRIEVTATSAVREAKNQIEFTTRVQSAVGVEIRILSPVEEGKLIHLAVASALNLHLKNCILMDIGGGSVELIASESGRVKDVISFKMGTLRPFSLEGASREGIKSYINGFKSQFSDFIGKNFKAVDLIVGTGGNLECLGDLRVGVFKKKSSQLIRRREVDSLAKDMLRLDQAARACWFDLSEDRAEVIVPATLTTRLLMKVTELDELLIPRVGLRDGVILDLSTRDKKTMGMHASKGIKK